MLRVALFAVPTESGKRSILPPSKAHLLGGVGVVLVGGGSLGESRRKGLAATEFNAVLLLALFRFGLAVSRLGLVT